MHVKSWAVYCCNNINFRGNVIDELILFTSGTQFGDQIICKMRSEWEFVGSYTPDGLSWFNQRE